MTEQASAGDLPVVGRRLKAGIALFVLGLLVPIADMPLIAGLGLSGKMATFTIGALMVAGGLLEFAGVVVMGKPGYLYIRSRFLGFLKRYGPPEKVSRTRYNIGLVMFCVPIVFGWSYPYLPDLIPGLIENPTPYAVIGDVIFLASLFVLGGDFWDKLRSLFVHEAKVIFPAK